MTRHSTTSSLPDTTAHAPPNRVAVRADTEADGDELPPTKRSGTWRARRDTTELPRDDISEVRVVGGSERSIHDGAAWPGEREGALVPLSVLVSAAARLAERIDPAHPRWRLLVAATARRDRTLLEELLREIA